MKTKQYAGTVVEEKKPKEKGWFRDNIEAVIIAIILALFIRTFVVQAFKIPSASMENTLLIGDQILVNKFIYGIKLPFARSVTIPVTKPDRGDIVVFVTPEDKNKTYFKRRDFIKRVVGVEGDEVMIKNKKVYVNGEPQQDDFAIHLRPNILPGKLTPRDNMAPVIVPENSLFVMGDSRDNSHDSRFWGFVPLDVVKGKAFIIYWSWDRKQESWWNKIRTERLGQLLK